MRNIELYGENLHCQALNYNALRVGSTYHDILYGDVKVRLINQ